MENLKFLVIFSERRQVMINIANVASAVSVGEVMTKIVMQNSNTYYIEETLSAFMDRLREVMSSEYGRVYDY